MKPLIAVAETGPCKQLRLVHRIKFILAVVRLGDMEY